METEKEIFQQCGKTNVLLIGIETKLSAIDQKLGQLCEGNCKNDQMKEVKDIFVKQIQPEFSEVLKNCFDLYQKVKSIKIEKDTYRLILLRLETLEKELEDIKKAIPL